MSLTRRELLARAAALGATVVVVPVLGCAPPESTPTDTDDTRAPPGDGLPTYTWDGAPGPEDAFAHGVASGDPLADSVLLWTRVSREAERTGPLAVFVEVARDEAFTERVAARWVETDRDRDDAVTVDLTELEAGTTWFYRFSALGRTSPVGRTRTLPLGRVEHVRLGACSCSNYAYGFFHAYGHLAARDDLDLVVHLGDYVYEYANEGEGETYGTFRLLDPPHEMITLDDYRRRYACYRRDPDLGELHRRHPMIHLWDDHEFACDPVVGGADNHQEATEGAWTDRVDAALRAYGEWMPTRLGDGGRIYRAFVLGDLVELVIVDRQRRFLWPAEDDAGAYLGKEQAGWLDARLAEVRARWLLLGTATTFGSRRADGVSGSSWDPMSRGRVLDACAAAGVPNLVVLVGDIHKFDALDVVADPDAYDPLTGDGSAGVEVAVGSISSPGSNSNTDGVPQFFWSSGVQRGYVVVDVTPDRCRLEAWGFGDLAKYAEQRPAEALLAAFEAADGARHLVRVDEG